MNKWRRPKGVSKQNSKNLYYQLHKLNWSRYLFYKIVCDRISWFFFVNLTFENYEDSDEGPGGLENLSQGSGKLEQMNFSLANLNLGIWILRFLEFLSLRCTDSTNKSNRPRPRPRPIIMGFSCYCRCWDKARDFAHLQYGILFGLNTSGWLAGSLVQTSEEELSRISKVWGCVDRGRESRHQSMDASSSPALASSLSALQQLKTSAADCWQYAFPFLFFPLRWCCVIMHLISMIAFTFSVAHSGC